MITDFIKGKTYVLTKTLYYLNVFKGEKMKCLDNYTSLLSHGFVGVKFYNSKTKEDKVSVVQVSDLYFFDLIPSCDYKQEELDV